MIEAITRIEPIFDPTRVDGPEIAPHMRVSSGTAVMESVFADRWHRVDLDPNVNVKVAAIALAWRPTRALSCGDFTKSRPHGVGEPGLTALDASDCRRLRRVSRSPGDLTPMVLAAISVPVFAAPFPGSRQSSVDFWATRRARISEIQSLLRQRLKTERSKAAPTSQ